ncbi:hypothetical protein AB3R30_18730 [Leptolyngbyaceae cyanobacterium UHCC 1019]
MNPKNPPKASPIVTFGIFFALAFLVLVIYTSIFPSKPQPDSSGASSSPPTAPTGSTAPTGTVTTKDGYIAAATEADLDKAIGFSAAGDKAAWNQFLAEGKIILLKPGIPVTVEQCLGFACSKVKLRAVGKTTEFYTISEALEK